MPFSVSDILLSNQTFNSLDDEFHSNVKKFSNAYAEANPAVKMEKLQADLNPNSYASSANAINQRQQLANSANSTQSQYSNIMGSCTPSPSIHTPPDTLGYNAASFNNDQAVAAAAAYLNSYNNPNNPGYANPTQLVGQQMGYHHHHPHHAHQINRLSPPQFQNIQNNDPAAFYNNLPGSAAAAAAAAYQNNSSWFNGQSDRLTSKIFFIFDSEI